MRRAAVPALIDPVAGAAVSEGRPVITRADLIARLGIARSTAETWYRHRDTNGHPEPVRTVGRQLYFDEDAILAWARAQLDSAPPPARIVRDGRALITRAELSRQTGLSSSALAGLYSRRADTGHPEAARRDGAWLYFDEAGTLAWHAARNARKTATLTAVDRNGDPDELLDRTDAAQLLGYAGPTVIDSYRARNVGYFPEPDDTRPLRWRRGTLWAFADRRSRPGRAGHAHASPSKPGTAFPAAR